MKRIYVLAVIVLLCSSCKNTKAQTEITCLAKAPAEVGVNQKFQYTVTTNEKGTVLDFDFGKFEVVSGPSTSSSTSISIQNGKTEQKTEYSYSYILSINKEGTFTIPGGSISVDGKIVETNPVSVKVVKFSKSAQKERDEQGGIFNFQWPDMDSFFEASPFSNRNGHDDEKVEYKDDITK